MLTSEMFLRGQKDIKKKKETLQLAADIGKV